MRRFVCARVFQASASAGAAALAVLVLFACGQQSGRSTQSAASKGMIVGCSERSEADFPGAFSDPHNLVVGPLALVRGAEPTTASAIRRFGGQKFPLLLAAGHTVTVRISRGFQQSSGLAYGPLGQRGVSHQAPYHRVTRDTPRTITFVACRRGDVRSSNSADGAVTFWSGLVLTRRPACVPLDVYIGNSPSPRRAVLSLGVDRCGVRTHAIKLSGATARDRGIAAELDRYIDRNYGNAERAVPPTSEHLPSRQRRALGELTDNIAELKGSIERIAVDHTVVTVKTDLDRDKEGLQTARLICTVIYGADVADFTKGHRVAGADSTVLVECSPRTSPLE